MSARNSPVKYDVFSGESFVRGLPFSQVKSANAKGSGFFHVGIGRARILRARRRGRELKTNAQTYVPQECHSWRSPQIFVMFWLPLERAVERDVEQENVDARLAEEAELPAFDVRDRAARRTAAESTPRARATRATCRYAFAGEMCGSSPDADAVTMSVGISPSCARRRRSTLSTRGRDERVGELAVGRTLVRAARRRRVVAVARGRRTRMEVLGCVNGCPISSLPTTRPFTVTSEPFA